MTQMECELALIKLGEAAREIVRMYNPEINFTSINLHDDGFVSVDGIIWDSEKHMIAVPNMLDAIKYGDGTFRFGVQEAVKDAAV